MLDSMVRRFGEQGSMLVMLLLTGCGASPAVPPGGEPLDNVNLHALMTDRIAILSNQLDALTFEQHRTESDLEELRGRRSAEVATAATRLEQAALRIGRASSMVPGPLASEERFRALAAQLAENASELAQLAREERVDRFPSALERINVTCNACHGLYRDR